MTYCVVPDPARPLLDQTAAFFGMAGGFSRQTETLIPLLGIRWLWGNMGWEAFSPLGPKQFLEIAPPRSTLSDGSRSWPVFFIPSLYGRPPVWAHRSFHERLAEWPLFVEKAAKYYVRTSPESSERLYQVTWEPDMRTQFDGTPEQLLQWHQAAFNTLHANDPKAKVLGPTSYNVDPNHLGWTDRLLDMGLWRYIDGLSVHTYVPSKDPLQLLGALRHLRQKLKAVAQRDIPIYSTESGYQSNST